ncbi:hypothetical protein [Halostagnicola bangensis]
MTSEQLMLVAMLGVSSYMLIESFSFSYEAGIFPRFAAVVAVCGCVLLLVRAYLPEPIRQVVTESAGMFDQYDEEFQGSEDDTKSSEGEVTEDEDTGAIEGTDRGTVEDGDSDAVENADIDSSKQAILVGLLAGYGLVGYVIGLVWATPLFILAFAKAFGLPRLMTLVIVVIGLVAAFAFNSILPVNMTDGVIF